MIIVRHFIGGEWADSASGETLDVINPANDQVTAACRRPGAPSTTARGRK